jgi:hypothetical protein
LEGIWNKAADILQLKDAIVPAPGIEGGMYVLSYGGKKPHLVIPKKNYVYACDSECPNFKGLGVCAHSVAVAEQNNKLPEYIEKLKKNKKIPNISQLANATMPKGKGRKGGQCPRKRKRNDDIETIIQNPNMMSYHSSQTTHSFDDSYHPPPTTHSDDSHHPPPTTHSFDDSASVTNTSNLQESPSSSGCFPISCLPPYTWQYNPSQYSGYFIPQHQHQHNSFILTKIAGNIAVCAGCRNKYNKKLPSPNDLCIKHKEWRDYTPAGSQSPKYRFGNVYYHFDPTCVWLRCPMFVPNQLDISSVLSLLDPTHKKHLATHFNITI